MLERERARQRVTVCVYTRTNALVHLCLAETRYRDKVMYPYVPGGHHPLPNVQGHKKIKKIPEGRIFQYTVTVGRVS